MEAEGGGHFLAEKHRSLGWGGGIGTHSDTPVLDSVPSLFLTSSLWGNELSCDGSSVLKYPEQPLGSSSHAPGFHVRAARGQGRSGTGTACRGHGF